MGKRRETPRSKDFDAPHSHGRYWRFGTDLPREATWGIDDPGDEQVGLEQVGLPPLAGLDLNVLDLLLQLFGACVLG